MLKWTGGSRRKVSTSRKSTQSKQKQYFELKRRLQQTPSTENQSETNKWGNPLDARSLDILSFVNLATLHQNKESVHTENNSFTQAFHNPSKLSSPAALKKFRSVDPTKANKACKDDHNSTCGSQEDNGHLSKLSPAMAVKKIISGLSNSPNESGSVTRTSSFHEPIAGKAHNFTEKVGDFGKFPPSSPLKSKSSDMKQKGKSNIQSEVSLLDLLDDEDSERISVQKLCHEAYAAFSIKGLGKVEVETPPQSPVPYKRGCPEPPQRAARCTLNKEFQSIPFGIEMDSLLHDTNLINDVSQSERMGDYGPVIDKTVFGKENQFEDIYSPNSYDNFDDSPDFGQDGAFDEHICDQIWEATYEETANVDLSGKRKDRLWDTNLFNLEDFNRTSPNENIFDPTLTGFEEYDDFPTLRTGTNMKRRLDLYSARAGPSCSPLTMEGKYLPINSHWKRDTPEFKRKSDFDGLFSQPVWPLKDGVADLLDTTSLRSEESCSTGRVKEVKNYSFQSCPQKRKINHMDDFQMNSNLNLNSPKFNNIPSQAHDKSTRRTKSSTTGSKLQRTNHSMEDMFLDSDCMKYTKSKEPSKSVTVEQRSSTNVDFHANEEEKVDIFNNPVSEHPKGMKSSCVGEVGLGMKEMCIENEGPKFESEKFSDEAENGGHTEADKCIFEESPLVFEACANGTPNTPAQSRQFERCNLTGDSSEKISPFPPQAKNPGNEKGKCDAQYQVMLQSYVFQLLCVQKVLLEASGKDTKKEADETGNFSSIHTLHTPDKNKKTNKKKNKLKEDISLCFSNI
ncbi:uncharacterized protein LOC144572620 isoform X2 [Carex rostrata]